MQFTPQQQQAIEQDGALVVTAGAGSGKTRVLVERYLRLLVQYASDMQLAPGEPPPLLAITFTEKAAREMRQRVRISVEQRLQRATPAERPVWQGLRDAIEGARISTIHSFCAALLRAQPVETGLDPGFVVLDEVDAGLLRTASLDQGLAQWLREAASDALVAAQRDTLQAALTLPELRGMLLEMLARGDQLRAVLADIPATADALQAQWADGYAAFQLAQWQALLADPAWQEASDTLASVAADAPTGDKIGAQVLRVRGWLATCDPACLPTDAAPLQSIELRGGSAKQWGDKATLDAARAALKTLRGKFADANLTAELDPELEQRTAQVTLAVVAAYRCVLATYRQNKLAQNALDFDDLEWLAQQVLQLPAVQQRWRRTLRAILVDEFQDTNDTQRAILYALVGIGGDAAPLPTDAPGLFVVGDGKQSIYRFRGADVGVFQQVQQEILHRNGQQVSLSISFRTHPPLLAWINRVMEKVLHRSRPLLDFETPFEELTAHRPAPPYAQCVELHLLDLPGSAEELRLAEAQRIAERMQALVAGAAGAIVYDRRSGQWRTPEYGDFALLFQTSGSFPIYADVFREAGIPFLTTAGRGYYDRPEVQDLLHLLRVLNDPADELALVGVLRSPLFAVDDNTIMRLRLANRQSLWDALHRPLPAEPPPLTHARTTLHNLYRLRGQLTVVELLRAALAATGYLAVLGGLPDGAQRCVNVEKLIEAVRRADTTDLRGFTTYLAQVLQAAPREGEAPLEAAGSALLMTVHASKGLEFPIVVLPDLSRTTPALRATWLAHRSYGLALCLRDVEGARQPARIWQQALAREHQMAQAEHERLLYVALTRAQDYLILGGRALQATGWQAMIQHSRDSDTDPAMHVHIHGIITDPAA